ncbi:MAG: hypothetical protein KTR16_04690 [Acidiferrobacterales bacterium]|nr:hypothetical protein [Acidiferrobacterales bacterium]
MQDTLTAGVILIGDEILSGSIQDLNLSYIAKHLETKGIRVRETRIVPDVEVDIIDAVNTLREKFNYVFTTGGIGPTHDDITSDSIAKAFGVKNVIQPFIFDRIAKHLKTKGVEFTPAAQRMAYAPEGAEIIDADQSIVPTYRKENVFVLAGVPRIMQMMLTSILDKLEAAKPIVSAEVHANVGEGEIAAALEIIQQAHPNIAIGSYPQDKDSTRSDYRVIFVVRGIESVEIKTVCDEILIACKSGGYQAIRV